MKLKTGDILFIGSWKEYATVLHKNSTVLVINDKNGIPFTYKTSFCLDYEASEQLLATASVQSQMKILCKHSDFIKLQKLYGIGTFFHDYSPLYNKICIKKPKFLTFKSLETKETITLHLAKAMKVLKKIGETYNSNYERVRIVKPMVKLQFIGEL